ncbi:MAG: shikimate kinase [Acidimicrobiales bacterium]|nr:shikimate kinase [Acidimicrobiales bacterium]
MAERLILIGMMGAGKSTVGRMVAARLGWEYLDSDEQVEVSTGRTVPEIFAERGEAAFRVEEARVLDEALSGARPVVVSAAGGVVLAEHNRALMARAGTVVWLRAHPGTLAARVGDGQGRPLLDEDPPTALAALDAVRRPLYAELAHVVVDVDQRSPEEVAAEVLRRAGLPAEQSP